MPNRQLVAVATQKDGKVVAVSDQSNDFYVVRFNVDGSRDLSFGLNGDGSVVVDVGAAGQQDAARAVLVDSQDRIVVAGDGGATVRDLALVRLAPDGKAVQINAHLHLGNAADENRAGGLAVQSDGTIVVAGTAQVAGDTDFALVRFDGASGAVVGSPTTRSLGTGNETLHGVAVYGAGPARDEIVLVGTTGTTGNAAIGVLQFTAAGTLDGTFHGGTPLIVDPTTGDDNAGGVATTPSGAFVLTGTTGTADRDVVVAGFLPSGAPDGGFAAGSPRVLTRPGADSASSGGVLVQRDGAVVVSAEVNGLVDAGVFRLRADGSSDQGFGAGGAVALDVNGNDDANAVALDAQGRILLVGDDAASAGFVARFVGLTDSDGDGVPDAADACPTTAGSAPNGCAPPAPAPEAVLKGKKVRLDTVLAHKGSAKCPPKATVRVTSKGMKVTKQLKARAVPEGCRVTGKVRLPAKPKKSAAVKVKVTGKRLVTKRLVAVRQ